LFKPIKKTRDNPIEGYEFEVTNAFDRGEIVGGFGYIEYDDPSRNQLIIMSKAAMDKRKPKYASANFWGGTVTEYVNGKRETVEKEGWQDEMYRKTLIREVYSTKYITRDPSKIDDNYQYLREREVVYAQIEAEQDALEYGNNIPIDISDETERLTDGQHEETPAGNGTKQDPDF
jgi:recombination protein RecT